MMRAGGGGTSTQCDLLSSPGWQEKLKHYLLNHVRVETNICWPSVQPSDPSELLAPPHVVSIISSQPSHCFLALSPPPGADMGRGEKAPWCTGAALQNSFQTCSHGGYCETCSTWCSGLLCCMRLLSCSVRFSESPTSWLIHSSGPSPDPN